MYVYVGVASLSPWVGTSLPIWHKPNPIWNTLKYLPRMFNFTDFLFDNIYLYTTCSTLRNNIYNLLAYLIILQSLKIG